MNKPTVNLSALDALGSLEIGSLSALYAETQAPDGPGRVMQLKLSDILEDPDQPRTEFAPEAMQDLLASMQANLDQGRQPIKQPISVKRHPTEAGKWLINNGARRYRCALALNLPTVPAIEDHEHDDFDQVIVNIQQESHTPLELADFIAKKLATGLKLKDIAQRLGKPASFVTKHASLIEMPTCVRQIYQAGRCRDVEALYLLTTQFPTYPDLIRQLCATHEGMFSKHVVRDALQRWQSAALPVADPVVAVPQDATPAEPVAQQDPAPDSAQPDAIHFASAGHDHGTAPSDDPAEIPAPPPADRPGRLRQPVLHVRYADRPATLSLTRRSAAGQAWIRFDEDGQEAEVELAQVQLVAIQEGVR